MTTKEEIEAASIDSDVKPILTALLAENLELRSRIEALESRAAVPEVSAMTAESPDGQGGVTVARYEKV